MGVLSGKDLLSGKYITALITDSANRIHFVPIKVTIGDFFIAEIEKEIYVFSLKDARHLIYRQTLAKSFRVIQYDTSHYKSLRAEVKELELMMQRDGLPKMNRLQLNVLSQLAKREKKDFKEHNIIEIIEAFEKSHTQNVAAVQPIIEYLEELDIEKIVTPLRNITDFVTEDLVATPPSFLGQIIPRYQRFDIEHKKITNTPLKGGAGFMKMVLVIVLGIAIVGGVYIAYDKGVFDGVTDFADNLGTIGDGFSGLPSPTQGIQTKGAVDYSDATIQAKYPEPQALVDAINSGEVDYNKLSSTMKSYVDGLETAP
jgi:hypothetical protein